MTIRITSFIAALAAAALCEAAPPSASVSSSVGADQIMRTAHSTEVPVEKNAPQVTGHPLTAVVVTQCNLLVAVYLTMPDGRLLRYDHTASVPADRLVQMAYTATRSERVEVSCNDQGVSGYERHEPL